MPPRPRGPRSSPGGWGSASRIQGRAEQFSGHLDDGDDPLVGHACRPDDPEHAEHRLAVGVGRRDDAAIVEDLVAGLVADEYLHASAFRLWSSRCRKSRFSLNASNSRRSFSTLVSSAAPMRLVSPLMTYSSRLSPAPLSNTCCATEIASSMIWFMWACASESWRRISW